MAAVSQPAPKHLGSYEPKDIGIFTNKQLVKLAIGVVPTIMWISSAVKTGMDENLIILVSALIMAIPVFLAFGKSICFDMEPEYFVIEYYRYHIKSKNIRVYDTTSLDDVIEIEKIKAEKKHNEELGIKIEDDKPRVDASKLAKTRFKDERFDSYEFKSDKKHKTLC